MKDNLIYGVHPVLEAMQAGHSIDKLFIQQDLKSDQLKAMKDQARDLNISVIKAPREKLNKLCRKNHQGVIAFTSPIEFGQIDEIVQQVYEQSETPFFIMLDKVSDVRNFGAIARSALSAGCHAIIIPHKGAAAINEESMKTSAGALSHIPVCKVLSLSDAIKMLYASGVKTISCHEKTEQYMFDVDMKGPVNLLFGNEGEGIDPHLVRMSQESAKIPMLGQVGSLNVSVAASVLMYETVRQRAFT